MQVIKMAIQLVVARRTKKALTFHSQDCDWSLDGYINVKQVRWFQPSLQGNCSGCLGETSIASTVRSASLSLEVSPDKEVFDGHHMKSAVNLSGADLFKQKVFRSLQ